MFFRNLTTNVISFKKFITNDVSKWFSRDFSFVEKNKYVFYVKLTFQIDNSNWQFRDFSFDENDNYAIVAKLKKLLIENVLIETKIIDCMHRVHFEIFAILCVLILLIIDRQLQNHLCQMFYRRFDFVDVVVCKIFIKIFVDTHARNIFVFCLKQNYCVFKMM